MIESAKASIEKGEKVKETFEINNVNRTVGAMLSGKVTKKWGGEGLPEDTIDYTFMGTAGQSFGAFLAPGITLRLFGDANDYLGKSLSGGKIIVTTHSKSSIVPHENIIVGNTLLYGATSGEVYIAGKAGERFAVRNSGAVAVVEGVGDHGCEYMTGGRVVILGETGKNFAAGMSGGIAYILEDIEKFSAKCNFELVNTDTLSDNDKKTLKDLIKKHVEYTDSPKGKEILENWKTYESKFIKVINPQYKAIVEGADATERGEN